MSSNFYPSNNTYCELILLYLFLKQSSTPINLRLELYLWDMYQINSRI